MTKEIELGKTGIRIHPIGLGANKISEADKATNTEYGGDIIQTAIEHGMNFIDTAYMYGKGVSEEIIGKTLKNHHLRKDAVIATKGAHVFQGDQVTIHNDPDFLQKAVEDSLRRLQTDYIDVYYIHFPDEDTPKYEAVGALQQLKEAGKIRAIGVSNFSLEQLQEANQDGYVDVVQDGYNLIKRGNEETLFPYCKKENISFVPYFPFASGLLAGKYDRDTVLTDQQKKQRHFHDDVFFDHLDNVEKLRAIAQKHDVEVSHIVLAFYLTKKPIDAVIPGARNRRQVIDNLRAQDVQLNAYETELIEQIFPIQ
ncbi:MAG TPA: aldo/keto reductase [Pseudogracilibacillus sp.]|nr:aldo/keto reductase [Pseudogracilibacillus sp.]